MALGHGASHLWQGWWAQELETGMLSVPKRSVLGTLAVAFGLLRSRSKTWRSKTRVLGRRIPHVGNGPNMVSESTASNTELSEFFCPHRVPGRELSEFLSTYYLCAKANSAIFSQNSPSLSQNSGSVSSLLRNSTLETVFRPFPIMENPNPKVGCDLGTYMVKRNSVQKVHCDYLLRFRSFPWGQGSFALKTAW